jgi:hypothetical protein
MRYLVNLPLLGALLLGWMIIHLTILTTPARGGVAALGAAFALAFGSIIHATLLAVTVLGCALAGGFDWVPADGRGSRVFLMLLAFGGLALVCALPLGISIETAGRLHEARWDPATIVASRAVGSGAPLVLLAYLAWLSNAPEPMRELPFIRYAALGAIGVLAVVGAVISVQELARWNRQAEAGMAAERAEEDKKADQKRQEFAALTDADPLLKWYQYSTYASPDDVRLEAMRRIAARSNLDAELIAVLGSENPLWAAEGVRFVADLPITPSPALAEAVRRRLDVYANTLSEEAKLVTYDGDKRLDYYEASKIRNALKAARRLAEVSRADLRPQIAALRRAVTLYPKSDMASRFPREVDEAEKYIAGRLAAAQ